MSLGPDGAKTRSSEAQLQLPSTEQTPRGGFCAPVCRRMPTTAQGTQPDPVPLGSASPRSAAAVLTGHAMFPSGAEQLISIQLQSLGFPLARPAFNELIV